MAARKTLWDDWLLFQNNEYTNPSLQLKKQGASFKTDQYGEFTYRPSLDSPPSMQEFYESVLNGIILRNKQGLYQGEYQYYQELQQCLHEFIKILNFKSELLIEVFQQTTHLNLSQEQLPNIVIPCSSCGMFIYINFYCKSCFGAFYCDLTCLKNQKIKHEVECEAISKVTPTIFYPLQVEIHCGGLLNQNVMIFYEHEQRMTLKHRGQNFMANLNKVLLKNKWLKNNRFAIQDQQDNHCIKLEFLRNESDDRITQQEEDGYLKMKVIQELRVIFLNQGAILQDIIKESYDNYNHYIHIYYFPC